MSNTPKFSLRLNKIHCYLQDEGDGDELFLKYEGKRIWPSDKKYTKSTPEPIEVKVKIDDLDVHCHLKIELWDYDFFTPNDKLGVFTMQLNERGGPFITDLTTKGGAKYSLEWEVY